MERWRDWPLTFRVMVVMGEARQRAGQFASAAAVFLDALTFAPDDEAETEMLARVFRCTDPALLAAAFRQRRQARAMRAVRQETEKARR